MSLVLEFWIFAALILGISCPHSGHQRSDPNEIHDPFDIVGKHMQGHLGGNLFQRLHLEVGCSHPGLDGAEGMLNRLAALAHLLRVLVKSLLDNFKNMFLLPAGKPSLLARGASILDDTTLAGIAPITAQHQPLLLGREAISELFTGRTNVNVFFFNVTKVRFDKTALGSIA